MKKYVLPMLTAMLCLSATGAFAQKGKGLTQVLDAAITRQSAKQLPGKIITTRTGTYFYHPVFGYVPSAKMSHHDPDLYFATEERLPTHDYNCVQRSPFFEHQLHKTLLGRKQAFELGEYIDLPTITQAGYLWRMAHPDKSLQNNPYLYEWAQLHVKQAQEETWPFSERRIWEQPNYLLLKHLLRTNFTPTSYAKLYELTPVYPKHVTLGLHGFPVKTAEADYANLLDAYLMLSNPKEMKFYNTYGQYTPFILTKEEHAAANKLLKLREQGEKLPPNPTASDLLALAYNRLETHTAPYSQIDREDVQTGIYKAYPNYPNTQLYRMIKNLIKGQYPIEISYVGYTVLENEDMTHLIVLDAVMGGVNQQDLAEVRRALDAFEKLCAEVHPKDNQAISHLLILQKNLHVVFDKLIDFNDLNIDWAVEKDPRWQKAKLANQAAFLLNAPIRDLVGRNWKHN